MHFQCVQGIENRRMKEKMPKCAVGTQRRHNPHIKVDFAAVAVVLFSQFHWQLGLACCSMWRMRNVCKSMKMPGSEEKLWYASCYEHFCCFFFIFHLFFAQDFLDIFPFDFIWVIAQGICNWLLMFVCVCVLHVFGQFECTLYVGVAR